MSRRTPPDRLQQLVHCATQVFIDVGYTRTQMADVADALGVAKGTLYLYVESKEALFDLVVRCADATAPPEPPKALPIRTPKAGATLRYVRERLAKNQPLPALAAGLSRPAARDVRTELETIVRELYRALYLNRTAIRLLDRCAHDYPELAAVWYKSGRGQLLAALTAYLEAPTRRRRLLSGGEPAMLARLIIENAVLWAVHRHWDPAPQHLDERTIEETLVAFVVAGIIGKEE
jgi:AcrR family transcriptional regulator